MRGLGRKRGKMDLTRTQVVVDKPKWKYNFKKEKEMKARKVEMLKFKKLGALFVGEPLNSNDEKNVKEIVERKESPLR
jgi:hypothetical protein